MDPTAVNGTSINNNNNKFLKKNKRMKINKKWNETGRFGEIAYVRDFILHTGLTMQAHSSTFPLQEFREMTEYALYPALCQRGVLPEGKVAKTDDILFQVNKNSINFYVFLGYKKQDQPQSNPIHLQIIL